MNFAANNNNNRGGGRGGGRRGGRGGSRGGRGGGRGGRGGNGNGNRNGNGGGGGGGGGNGSGKYGGLTRSQYKEKKKPARRAAQAAKLKQKMDRESSGYLQQVAKNRQASFGNNGFPAYMPQTTPESQLFARQGSAGIKFDQYDNIHVETSGHGSDQMPVLQHFGDLVGLPNFLSRNITLMRYERPTPIQSHALPTALNGRDLMCCAQTGSGKTCAFLLPVVIRLGAAMEQGYLGRKWADHFEGNAAAPIAIVLAPTRELAQQIELEAEKLCNASGLISCTVYGGSPGKWAWWCSLGIGLVVLGIHQLFCFCFCFCFSSFPPFLHSTTAIGHFSHGCRHSGRYSGSNARFY